MRNRRILLAHLSSAVQGAKPTCLLFVGLQVTVLLLALHCLFSSFIYDPQRRDRQPPLKRDFSLDLDTVLSRFVFTNEFLLTGPETNISCYSCWIDLALFVEEKCSYSSPGDERAGR